MTPHVIMIRAIHTRAPIRERMRSPDGTYDDVKLLRRWLPVQDKRDRRGGCVFQNRIDQEPAIGCNVVFGGSAKVRSTADNPGLKQCDRLARIESVTVACNRNGHQPRIRRNVVMLLAVPPPPPPDAAFRSNLPLPAWTWGEWSNVNLFSARLVGLIGHPPPVR